MCGRDVAPQTVAGEAVANISKSRRREAEARLKRALALASPEVCGTTLLACVSLLACLSLLPCISMLACISLHMPSYDMELVCVVIFAACAYGRRRGQSPHRETALGLLANILKDDGRLGEAVSVYQDVVAMTSANVCGTAPQQSTLPRFQCSVVSTVHAPCARVSLCYYRIRPTSSTSHKPWSTLQTTTEPSHYWRTSWPGREPKGYHFPLVRWRMCSHMCTYMFVAIRHPVSTYTQVHQYAVALLYSKLLVAGPSSNGKRPRTIVGLFVHCAASRVQCCFCAVTFVCRGK